jgi:hypothetical protein
MLINEGILHQCGAFWSEPMVAHFVLSQEDAQKSLAGRGAGCGQEPARSRLITNDRGLCPMLATTI